ncbi:MAG: phosphate/phosphite/phosphonate ABC transporter substrate-binding protein [Alphaproteobacteria bacterium]|nr:phosphate/phosphite/phosphonate ABC transporter substrate-binding protein [Alphaproteobacteria bacterium]
MSANSYAEAEDDCQNGALDSRYCDRDQDLTADLPTEPSDWLDPSALIFSYTPVEDPAVYEKVWDGFIDHLEAATGKRVIFFPVQSYAAQYEAMRSGRLHIAGINTGGTPIAVNCAGYVPFAMMAADDGSYGYEMEIIVPSNSGIQTPIDLKGRTLTFTSPTSNSGFKAPSAILKAEFGLVADQDYQTAYSGKHDNSILGVANNDYEAAAVANSVLARMIDRDAVERDAFRSIYKSQTFPTTSYGHAYNLHPEVAAQVRLAFATFPWAGSGLAEEFAVEDGFVSITYDKDWQIVRTVDSENGATYDCR